MLINNIDFEIDISHPILKLSETEKAYIAGLIDADGCIGLFSRGIDRNKTLSCQIAMTDLDIMNWLYEIIGFIGSKNYISRPNKNWKDYIRITIQSSSCILFLSLILPYLRIKKTQAKLVIEYGLLVKKGGTNTQSRYSIEILDRMSDIENTITKLNKKGKDNEPPPIL